MDKGIYHMVGDNEHWYNSNARLIFATTEDPKKMFIENIIKKNSNDYYSPKLTRKRNPGTTAANLYNV